MSGKHNQVPIEGEREDDVAGIPHGDTDGDKDSKGSPGSDRQGTETAPDS